MTSFRLGRKTLTQSISQSINQVCVVCDSDLGQRHKCSGVDMATLLLGKGVHGLMLKLKSTVNTTQNVSKRTITRKFNLFLVRRGNPPLPPSYLAWLSTPFIVHPTFYTVDAIKCKCKRSLTCMALYYELLISKALRYGTS